MNKILKSTLGITAAAVTLGVTLAQGTVSAWSWGDNTPGDNGRKSYTLSQLNSNALGDEIVLNSISYNEAIGTDEKNFVATREYNGASAQGTTHGWNHDEITVEDGKTYTVRIYAHNNNPGGMDAKATGAHALFSIDQGYAEQVSINGFLNIDKTNHVNTTRYWDDVVFKSNNGQKFKLVYENGSALIEGNYVNKQLSDDVANTEKGVQIGYDNSLNGEIPGCFEYATYTTIRVKAVFESQNASDFTVSKQIRRVGESNWSEYIEGLKVGDKVEFQIQYHNASNVNSANVIVQDVLPANMKYIEGTARLINGNHAEPGDVLEDKLVSTGANIGGYRPGHDGYVRFTAEVIDNGLACGTTKLVNWGKVKVGDSIAEDSAEAYVDKTCTPNTPNTGEKMPATGPIGIIGGVVGAGALTTAGGFYLKSRKARK